MNHIPQTEIRKMNAEMEEFCGATARVDGQYLVRKPRKKRSRSSGNFMRDIWNFLMGVREGLFKGQAEEEKKKKGKWVVIGGIGKL